MSSFNVFEVALAVILFIELSPLYWGAGRCGTLVAIIPNFNLNGLLVVFITNLRITITKCWHQAIIPASPSFWAQSNLGLVLASVGGSVLVPVLSEEFLVSAEVIRFPLAFSNSCVKVATLVSAKVEVVTVVVSQVVNSAALFRNVLHQGQILHVFLATQAADRFVVFISLGVDGYKQNASENCVLHFYVYDHYP